MYPVLYKSNETDFLHNGLGLLKDAIKAPAVEELNGRFELQIEYPVNGFLADVIDKNMIIRAKANDKQNDQLFRINAITKNMDNDSIIIDAQHITYDLAHNFVEKMEANKITKKQVMEKIGASTAYKHPFNLTSTNTTTVSSTSLYRTNPLQMVGGMEGSILQIWGGQIERDNFNLVLHDRRGHDDGVLVKYRKNLTGLEARFDYSDLVTRIYPFKMIDETDDEPARLITVEGKYIDSPHIDDYDKPYILPIDFSNEEDVKTSKDLYNVAKDWFKKTNRDKAKASLEVEFEHLWETEEYKDLAVLELVGMGDTITIEHEDLGIYAKATINYIEYDVLSQTNNVVKAGNPKGSLTDSVNKVDDVVKKVDKVEQSANQAIISANGKNTINYGPDEPSSAQKDDLWFKVVDGEYTQTYRFDGVQWQLVIDMDVNQAKEQSQKAVNDANEAVANANLATQNAQDAIDKAQSSFDKAVESAGIADNALSTAQTSFDKASNAEDLANTSKQLSETTSELVDLLESTVDGHATEITKNANEISRKMSTVDADKKYATKSALTQTSDRLSSDISAISKDMSTKFSSFAQTVDDITSQVAKKADDTELQTFKKQTADSFAQTVNKTEYDKNNNVINNQFSEMTQTLDGFRRRVKDNEGNILTVQETATSLVKRFDNLEIGGRNLIYNSAFNNGLDGWGHNGASTIELTPEGYLKNTFTEARSTPGIRLLYNKLNLEKGTYTLTLKADTNNLASKAFFRMYLIGDSSGSFYIDIPRTNGMGIVSVTFDIPEDRKNDTFYILTNNSLTVGDFIIYDWLVLMKGNKRVSDWTPAPEDTEAKFHQVAETIDGIQRTISDNKGNINKTTELANALQNRMTDAEGNINTLNRTASSLDSTIDKLDRDTKSQITQLSDNINARVKKGDVINQINISDEGILIDGENVHITGQTTIDDASIDGAKIKDASIGTAQIGTIDASKITTGTLIAIDIHGVLITGSLIKGTNIYVNGDMPEFLYSNALDTNPETKGIHTYIRPKADGEVRTTVTRTIDRYVPLRTQGVLSPPLANAYVGTDKELRVMGIGLSDSVYRDVRANVYHGAGFRTTTTSLWMGTDSAMHVVNKGYVDNSTNRPIYRDVFSNNYYGYGFITQSTNLYLGSDNEVRFVNKGYVESSASNPIYRDVRASVYRGIAIDLDGTTSATHFYVRPSANGEVRFTSRGTTDSYRPVRASKLYETSSEKYKKDIKKYEDSAIDLINSAVIYDYEKDGSNGREIGLIIERETPSCIVDGDAIDGYSMRSLAWKAIQELDTKTNEINEKLLFKIAHLEGRISKMEMI